MPSMKCGECKDVAKCRAVPQRDENGKTVLLYLCPSCRRDYLADLEATQDGTAGGDDA